MKKCSLIEFNFLWMSPETQEILTPPQSSNQQVQASEVSANNSIDDDQVCASQGNRQVSVLEGEHDHTEELLCDVSCDCTGCSIGAESPTVFQPKESAVLSTFERSGRRFLPTWYKRYTWLTLCVKC